ncbi:MAG: type II toxin-antitoxin system RelE/ParE family toxin [Betaproteobacteria bacterium]|nr:type II toxin-antitoxin system RelE/ParE family toxin [Betaproteobacteria bacterium]
MAYYESLQPGKGLELAEQIEAAIQHIQTFPESAPITRGSVRSIVVQPSSRWSYTLHYRAKTTYIRILAFAHQKRQPFYWFGRR